MGRRQLRAPSTDGAVSLTGARRTPLSLDRFGLLGCACPAPVLTTGTMHPDRVNDRWHFPMLAKKIWGPRAQSQRRGAPWRGRCAGRLRSIAALPLFALGFADKPFESGHVGYPE